MDSSITKIDKEYWQDLSFPDKIDHLFETGHAADCKFIVGAEHETSELIFGHKFMFILVSPVFERMFQSQFIENHRSTEIRLRDVEPDNFKNFRFMIYNNDESSLAKLTLADIVKMYPLCDQYMTKSISENCIKHIWKCVGVTAIDNLIILFGFALSLEDNNLLLEAVKEKIKIQEKKVATTLYDLPDYAFFEYMSFLSQLKEGSYTIPLLHVINLYFEANNLLPIEEAHGEESSSDVTAERSLQKPVQVDSKVHIPFSDDEMLRPKTNNNLLNNLFGLIKFSQMHPSDFIDGPGKLAILSSAKKYEILSYLYKKFENLSSDQTRSRYLGRQKSEPTKPIN